MKVCHDAHLLILTTPAGAVRTLLVSGALPAFYTEPAPIGRRSFRFERCLRDSILSFSVRLQALGPGKARASAGELGVAWYYED